MHLLRKSLLITTLSVLPAIVFAGGDPDDLADNEALGASLPAAQSNQVLADQQSKDAASSKDRSIQLYASDKTAEFLYEREGPLLGLQNTRSNAGFIFSEERDNALTGSIMYDSNQTLIPSVNLAFGLKAFAGLLSIENADVFGLGASIEASYLLPIQKFPLELSAALNYAPDILTFGQSDRIIDWNVRAGIPLTSQIDGFIGFRFLQFDTRPGDLELDDHVHLGIRWNLAN